MLQIARICNSCLKIVSFSDSQSYIVKFLPWTRRNRYEQRNLNTREVSDFISIPALKLLREGARTLVQKQDVRKQKYVFIFCVIRILSEANNGNFDLNKILRVWSPNQRIMGFYMVQIIKPESLSVCPRVLINQERVFINHIGSCF